MTVATNALLEGRTARTALLATAGFTDVIELGRQNRAAPVQAVPLRAGAARAGGAALRRARAHGTRGSAARAGPRPGAASWSAELASAEPEAVAVSLLHSYADPSHERAARRAARRAPARRPTCRSPAIWWARSASTSARPPPFSTPPSPPCWPPTCAGSAADARALGLREPQIMQSSGGLTDPVRAGAHAALTVLSGPAGGVGGALRAGASWRASPHVLCFDMGGTSCDVCLIDGAQVPETAERAIAGRPLSLPALDIHTVGAGGGSIAWRDPGGALRVGPASAGASPGPPATGAAAATRRSPTPTSCSVGCSRTRRWRAACRWTGARPSARSRAWRASSTWSRWRARKGSCASPRRRCWGRCA